jgi:hypothetical protein
MPDLNWCQLFFDSKTMNEHGLVVPWHCITSIHEHSEGPIHVLCGCWLVCVQFQRKFYNISHDVAK